MYVLSYWGGPIAIVRNVPEHITSFQVKFAVMQKLDPYGDCYRHHSEVVIEKVRVIEGNDLDYGA